MGKLREMAEALILAGEKKREAEELYKKQKLAEKTKALYKEFKIAFADYVPLLKDEGVKIKADFDKDQGVIIFSKGKKRCIMEFNNKSSYRYGGAGRVFGEWSIAEGFVLFIYDNLLREKL